MRAISSERLYTAACLAGALAALVFGLGYVLTLSPPRDAQGLLIGHDFVNVWMGARAALSGHPAALFGFAHYQTLLRDAFGAMPAHNWSYPPHLFLMIWPLGFLPYFGPWRRGARRDWRSICLPPRAAERADVRFCFSSRRRL